MIRFNSFLGECSSKEWISQKLHNGDFDYWLVMRIVDMSEANPDYQDYYSPRFWAELYVVAPSVLPVDLLRCAGAMDGNYEELSELEIVGNVFEYGYAARVWNQPGEAALSLMMEAYQEAQIIPGMLGLYLDHPVNRIGRTGWDMLGGFRKKHAA